MSLSLGGSGVHILLTGYSQKIPRLGRCVGYVEVWDEDSQAIQRYPLVIEERTYQAIYEKYCEVEGLSQRGEA